MMFTPRQISPHIMLQTILNNMALTIIQIKSKNKMNYFL